MKKRSIAVSILVPAISILIVFVVAQTLLNGSQSSQAAKKLTDELLSVSIQQNATLFSSIAADSYGAVTALEPVINEMRKGGTSRESVINTLGHIVENSPAIYGIWTGWEPNAYDGKDAQYANQPYHDETGRFIPYCYSTSAGLGIDILKDYTDTVAGEYYQGPLNSGKIYMTEPYSYEIDGVSTLLYSIGVPIKDDSGKVIGVIGVDVKMDTANDALNKSKIMETGYVFTLSPAGLISTHPKPELLMTSYTSNWLKTFEADIKALEANGGSFTREGFSDVTNTYNYLAAQAVAIGATGKYWIVCGVIPRATVNESSTQLIILSIIVGVALILAIGFALFLLVRSQLKELPFITKMADTLALGDIDGVSITGIDSQTTKNEVSLLKRAFSNTVDTVREQVEALQRISKGDLTVTVSPKSDKDLLNVALSDMLKANNNAFSEILAAAEQVQTGSKQIANGSQALAQGSTQQAAAVEQLSSSISQIAHKTKENSDMAKKAASLSNAIKQNADKGSSQMNEMMEAVKQINDASLSISKVIKVIDDIAFQTNILALNAAVEAARAGQHGKGFAVVAEEVRSLAAKSAAAAKDTSGLISSSMEKAELGSRIASETAVSLQEIVSGINQSASIVSDIAKSSEEQTLGIAQINTGIDQVAQVVQQNSATAEESAAASEEMSSQSALLRELVDQFKINDESERRYPALTESSSRNKKLTLPPRRN